MLDAGRRPDTIRGGGSCPQFHQAEGINHSPPPHTAQPQVLNSAEPDTERGRAIDKTHRGRTAIFLDRRGAPLVRAGALRAASPGLCPSPWEGCDLIAAMRRDQISVPWVIDGRSKTGSSSSCRRACINTRTGRNGHPRQPRQPQGQRRSPSFRARGVTASSCRPTAPTSVRSSKSWESLKAFYALQSLAT